MPRSVTLVGAYEPEYPRVDVIERGCLANGVPLERAHVEPGNPRQRVARLRRLLRTRPITTDFAFVPAFCHHEVAVVRRFFAGPIVFDPLVSRYMTKILDYRRASRFSVHALVNYLVDRSSLRLADFVLADTRVHGDYYCRAYGIPAGKAHTLYVGYDSDDFSPQPRPEAPGLTVGFYGSFIPLHGVETIVRAAHILRDRPGMRFELAGDGHTHAEAVKLAGKLGLDNVHFLGHTPYRQLCATINAWDICLGIFGHTLKTDLVIPNKVFHYAACGKPVITKDTPAIRELFTDDRDIVMCDATPESLARSVVQLADSPERRARIAGEACRMVRAGHTHAAVGKRLCGLLDAWWDARTSRQTP